MCLAMWKWGFKRFRYEDVFVNRSSFGKSRKHIFNLPKIQYLGTPAGPKPAFTDKAQPSAPIPSQRPFLILAHSFGAGRFSPPALATGWTPCAHPRVLNPLSESLDLPLQRHHPLSPRQTSLPVSRRHGRCPSPTPSASPVTRLSTILPRSLPARQLHPSPPRPLPAILLLLDLPKLGNHKGPKKLLDVSRHDSLARYLMPPAASLRDADSPAL